MLTNSVQVDAVTRIDMGATDGGVDLTIIRGGLKDGGFRVGDGDTALLLVVEMVDAMQHAKLLTGGQAARILLTALVPGLRRMMFWRRS